MKISNINPISFKGINVSKPSKKETSNDCSVSSSEIDAILKHWESDLGFLVACYDDYKIPTFNDLKAAVDKQKVPFKPFEPRDYTKFSYRTDVYNDFADSLGHKVIYVNQMVNKREQAIEELQKKENYLLSSSDNSSSITFPLYKGIEKVAGYKDEIKVLEDEFIFKVKEEKAGKNPEVFGSILFFGPNGNGKTYITKAIAEATDSNIAKVKISNNRDSQVQKGMEKIYSIAEKSEKRFLEDRTRTIIFIDEIDKMIFEGSPVAEEFSEFIKNCSERYHCSVFAATNNPLKLAVDYDNPDIFPIKMSIDIPNKENAKAVLDYYVADNADGKIDTEKLVSVMSQNEAEKGGKYSNAKIRKMVTDVFLASKKDSVNQQSLEDEFVSSSPDLTPEMVDKFEQDYDKLIRKVW